MKNNKKNSWDDFIDKINKNIIPKDNPDIENINKLMENITTGKVLDISIGDGVQSEYFINNGYDVYGTDISKLAIKTMKNKYPNYTWIVHDSKNKFPFGDNMFNIIFARLSLHYFSKDIILNILNEINRMLTIDGMLFIMVKISNTGNINTNKKSYSQKEWIELLSNNFNIIDSNLEYKKAYSFEKDKSNILEIFLKKKKFMKKFNEYNKVIENAIIKSRMEQIYDDIEDAINNDMLIKYRKGDKIKESIPIEILPGSSIKFDNGDIIKDYEIIGIMNENYNRNLLPEMINISNNSKLTNMVYNNIIEKFDNKEINDFNEWLKIIRNNNNQIKNKKRYW